MKRAAIASLLQRMRGSRPRSNAKHYKSNTITEIKEFPGRSHLMPAEQGWEEIADYALPWAETHSTHQPQTAPQS